MGRRKILRDLQRYFKGTKPRLGMAMSDKVISFPEKGPQTLVRDGLNGNAKDSIVFVDVDNPGNGAESDFETLAWMKDFCGRRDSGDPRGCGGHNAQQRE